MGGSSADGVWTTLRSLPIGQRIDLVDGDGRLWSGSIIPPHDLSGDHVVTLKLESGYNVGVRVDERTRYELVGDPPTRPPPIRRCPRAAAPSATGSRS